jgi:glycosyltransferase involved in cell wall biosynthesis
MRDLTALILTWNEQENIERTLSAVSWAPQVLIIDSFSTDETCTIASRAANVTILQRAFDTHTQQWNFGLDSVTTLWVLSLDADYVMGAELAEEIRNLDPPNEIAGYAAAFRYLVYGHALRTSIYPPRTVLFRKDRARYEDDGHTQRLHVKGPIPLLQGKIDHDDRKPLSRWIVSQDRYMLIEARHLLASPNPRLNQQDRLRKRIYFAPTVMFLYLLFVRGLIFDGWPGWYYAFQRTLAEMLLSLRLLSERYGLEKADAKVDSR